MKVFLLGAGASKSYKQSPTGIEMPIATDFFQIFSKLSISSNPWVLIDGLISYLCVHRNMADLDQIENFLRSGVNIEILHSEIEHYRDMALKRQNQSLDWNIPFKAYNQLTFLFVSVINEIQNGPISLAHLKIASLLSERDAVITFNWDTLMDRALKKCTNWEPDNGYGVIPNKIFRNKWVKPRSIKIKSPKLIKLHGATNWIISHIMTDGNGNLQHSHDASPSSLFIFEYSDKAYPCYKGRYMEGYQPFSYGYYPPNLFKIGGRKPSEGFSCVQVTTKYPWQKTGISADNGLVSMPLIIPPVKEKQYNFYGELFDILWNEAEKLLAEAHHFIIIGYSFPATDKQSSTLFIKAFMRRKDIPKITIIDPSPELIMDKLKFEFGIPLSNIEVFNTKFSDDFDFEKIKFEG